MTIWPAPSGLEMSNILIPRALPWADMRLPLWGVGAGSIQSDVTTGGSEGQRPVS